MKTTETQEIGLRSGSDARTHGRVEEYAQLMKERLLSLGQSEVQAEAARMQIIDRFGKV